MSEGRKKLSHLKPKPGWRTCGTERRIYGRTKKFIEKLRAFEKR